MEGGKKYYKKQNGLQEAVRIVDTKLGRKRGRNELGASPVS